MTLSAGDGSVPEIIDGCALEENHEEENRGGDGDEVEDEVGR